MKTLLLVLLFAARAFAVTASQVVVPGWAGTDPAQMSSSANLLRCIMFPLQFSVVNADVLTFGVQTTGGSCAVGLYSADGTTLKLGGTATCTSAGAKVTTSTQVNLTAGLTYILCMCSSSTSTTIAGIDLNATTAMGLSVVLNKAGTIRVGTAGSCTNPSGILPSSITLPLTSATFDPPMAVIEGD